MAWHDRVEGPWFLVYFRKSMISREFYVLYVAACNYEVLNLLGEVFVFASSDLVKYREKVSERSEESIEVW